VKAIRTKSELRFIAIPVRIERKIFLFLCCALALSIPFKASYNSILCITLLVFWLVFMEKKFVWYNLTQALLISTLFWLALAGMTYTQNIDEGLFRLQQKSLLLIFPLVFGTIKLSWKKELTWIVIFVLLGVIIACLISLLDAIFYWIQHGSMERLFAHGLTEFINIYPYILALLCLISILILAETGLGYLSLSGWLNKKPIIIILIVFFSIFLLLLSVLQIMIAWMILIIAYAIRLNKNRNLLVGLIVALFFTIALSFFVPTLKTKVSEAIGGENNKIPLDKDASLGRDWNGFAVRRAVWECALDVVRANPWLGVGTGDGQDYLQVAYDNRRFYFASRHNRFNTHNQYLQTTVTFGVIGLVVWISSLLKLLLMFRHNWLLTCLLSFLMFAMLTESMFETNKGALLMAFLFTIFCFYESSTQKNKPNML
jgi:O-antigen ligase